MSDRRRIVIYHANCPDGFAAAWAAHSKLGDTAAYIPANYGQDPPDCTGAEVYIVDFSYKRPVMRQLLSVAHKVVVLDHHKTAEAELAGLVDEFIQRPDLIANPPGSELPVIRFDMNKSGGRLAWEYFHPGEPAPALIEYTEDRDLWRWELPASREISAALACHPRTFAEWDQIEDAIQETGFSVEMAGKGEAILIYQAQLVEAIARNAREIEIDGHKILAANSSVLFSEVAEKLAEGRPFGAVWFVRADGMTQWSLRSRDGGIDVSKIARNHGGGGHRNAAGYQTTGPGDPNW